MRAKAEPPNPDPPGTPMSPFVCVLYRHWLTYYCNLRGYSNKEIAKKLYIAIKTVEAHKASINRKLGFKNRVDLVHYALHHGLIDF